MDTDPRIVYFDHAATSWPKPPGVAAAMVSALEAYGGNPGRSAHRLGLDAARAIHSARHDIARYLGVTDSRDLSFQPGCTQGLNLSILGLLAPGDRVVVGPTEHNAVSRPLNAMVARGVEVVVAPADEFGVVDPDDVESLVRAGRTRAVVCQHASNVTGAIQPVADLADIAHAHGAVIVVDGAQAGGHLDVDLSALDVDAWACSGHKGLLGPQGIGVLYLSSRVAPGELISGGTGHSDSENPAQPTSRPERYEAGTPNTPGILGLAAAVRYLSEYGAEQRESERDLLHRLHQGVLELGGYRVLGPEIGEPRVPVLSVIHERVDADRLAFALDKRYGIAVRAGLHCAPWAHGFAATLDTGALRFGIGYGNTVADVDMALTALGELSLDLQ